MRAGGRASETPEQVRTHKAKRALRRTDRNRLQGIIRSCKSGTRKRRQCKCRCSGTRNAQAVQPIQGISHVSLYPREYGTKLLPDRHVRKHIRLRQALCQDRIKRQTQPSVMAPVRKPGQLTRATISPPRSHTGGIGKAAGIQHAAHELQEIANRGLSMRMELAPVCEGHGIAVARMRIDHFIQWLTRQ